jgi:hypothetical protein
VFSHVSIHAPVRAKCRPIKNWRADWRLAAGRIQERKAWRIKVCELEP